MRNIDKAKSVYFNENLISYDCGNGLVVEYRSRSKKELEEMDDGALVRYSRGGGIGHGNIDSEQNSVYVVEEGCGTKDDEYNWFKFDLYRTKTFNTLSEAFKWSILNDLTDLMWDCDKVEVKRATGKQFLGMDNEDIETYLGIMDGKLEVVIHNQFIGDRKALIDKILKMQKEHGYVSQKEFDDLIEEARNSGVPVEDGTGVREEDEFCGRREDV